MADFETKFAIFAAEYRSRDLHFDGQTKQVLVRLPQADDAKRGQHEGEHESHAVLVVDPGEKQHQQHDGKQVAETRGQNVQAPIVQQYAVTTRRVVRVEPVIDSTAYRSR